MRDKYARFNTHIVTVKGLITRRNSMYKSELDVRFTSDDNGETLSIASKNTQFSVRYSEVEKLIDETRKDRDKKS